MARKEVDKPFLISVIILIVAGFFVFVSASMGLLAREHGVEFKDVLFNQTVLGLIGGTVALLITSHIHYRFWRKYSLLIFGLALLMTLLVFIPGVGFEHGGARRWIDLGVVTFQPSEFLKFAFIIYFSAWLSGMKRKVDTFKFGLIPFSILLAVTSFVLLLQPDTDTLAVIFFAGLAIFITAGAKWWHALVLLAASFAGLAGVALLRPYIRERLLTFLDPTQDPLGAGYQIQQSLIAIGSGGWFGRGFGQSIQKFDYLPEPIGDSIFAVMAEEFGFIGGLALIGLFVFFTFRGLRIAITAPDVFSRLLVVGIVILIVAQSFVNIGAMLGVLPLSGIPLVFVSHGGSALFITLAEIGIILNISKYCKKRA